VSGGPSPLPPPPFLYPIVDAGLVPPARVAAVVAALAAAGARIVQVRAKGIADGVFAAVAREAVAAAHATGTLLVVNDRPDVARLAGADGVHVGQDDLDPADVRALAPGALVGVSTHGRAQLQAAAGGAADYVAVGPVFATATKARPDPVVGLGLVRAARAMLHVPLVAIGGITRANARDVVAAGADGLAVASAVCAAPDPAEAFRALAAEIRPAG
jgi:thiamine-phosphate pyrophosphorylase